MVALALKRELGISYASVGHTEARILIDGRYTNLYLPKSVEKKIRFWDGFHFVFPFSFELVLSDFLTGSSIILGAQRVHPAAGLVCRSPQAA